MRGKPIFVGDLAKHAAGIAYGKGVGWNIPHDHRTRADYATFPDCHGPANGDAA